MRLGGRHSASRPGGDRGDRHRDSGRGLPHHHPAPRAGMAYPLPRRDLGPGPGPPRPGHVPAPAGPVGPGEPVGAAHPGEPPHRPPPFRQATGQLSLLATGLLRSAAAPRDAGRPGGHAGERSATATRDAVAVRSVLGAVDGSQSGGVGGAVPRPGQPVGRGLLDPSDHGDLHPGGLRVDPPVPYLVQRDAEGRYRRRRLVGRPSAPAGVGHGGSAGLRHRAPGIGRSGGGPAAAAAGAGSGGGVGLRGRGSCSWWGRRCGG